MTWIVGTVEKVAAKLPILTTVGYGAACLMSVINYSALTSGTSAQNAILGVVLSAAPVLLNPTLRSGNHFRQIAAAGLVGFVSPFAAAGLAVYRTFQTSKLLERREAARKEYEQRNMKPGTTLTSF